MFSAFTASGKAAVSLLLMLFLFSCAGTHYSRGRRLMADGNDPAAMRAFVESIKAGERSAESARELGIIYYNQGRYETARKILHKVFSSDSADGRTLLYLGSVYEKQEDYSRAISMYRRYRGVSRLEGVRADIEAKLTELLKKRLAAASRAALAQEGMLSAADIPDSSVAVLYFSNLGDKTGLDPLQKGLAEMLITDLSKVSGLQVVERVRLQTLLDEMKLEMSGLSEASSAPRLGKLLGASKVVQGVFVDLTDRSLRIDASVVPVKNDDTIRNRSVSGTLGDLFSLEKELVFSLIDEFGIRLSLRERDEIMKVPTENVLAFMAYCKGLDYEDRGQFDMASRLYDSALNLDPGFTKVKQSLSRTRQLAKGPVQLTAQTVPAAAPRRRREAPGGYDPKKAHMRHVGDVLNQRFLPGIDERKTSVEREEAAFGTPIVPILIQVDLPDRQP